VLPFESCEYNNLMKVCTLALLLQFRQGKRCRNIFTIKASQSAVAMIGGKISRVS
jgi:hypothetical protein